ncbi:MAG TPA: hypothetical protein ENN51_04760 [candidate division WOR-3 bacterium]|uniref:CBM-cenC domain-containing protein n=1 Tax=candidate division WOR-3 bacterium TaxID=2052148 RepID=A0A7V0T5I7_UNCW3|nr:hypothetical protein [candidate division WOR-3 bacterium]
MLRKVVSALALLLLAATAPAANILPNSSFELWFLDMPVGWLTSEPLLPGTAVRDSAARTGEWCVRLSAQDTSAFVTTVTIVRAGVHYRFSGWANVPALVGGSFLLQFLTLELEPLGTPALLPALRSDDYREYVRWVTAPDEAALVSVSFATLPGVTVWVDDVTLEDTTIAGIEELPDAASRSAPAARRVFATPAVIAGLDPGVTVCDAAGRRLTGPAAMRPFRVYFVTEP